MWWCKRLAFLLCLTTLTGCGFEPTYGTGSSARALLDRVEVSEPDDQYGYILVRELEDRIGRPLQPELKLDLSVKTERVGMAVTLDGRTNRYDLLGEVGYALIDPNTEETLTSGKVDGFTGYSTTGTTVSTLAAENDARERLMTILADMIVTELQAFALKNPL